MAMTTTWMLEKIMNQGLNWIPCLEVSMTSSHLALPRQGHLEQLLHVFAYLKKHHNAELILDPSDPVVDEASFDQKDWTSSEFSHIQGKEELPGNMPEP
jgi:hypothetical protein